MRGDLVVLSHLRWNHVFQRPHHLVSRFARSRRTLFFEEPLTAAEYRTPSWREERAGDVTVVTPLLPEGLDTAATERTLAGVLHDVLRIHRMERPTVWYYTPMALGFARDVDASAVVYDCMDELSLFKNAPSNLLPREAELLRRADVVFTGGRSLYEAKRERHDAVYCFPSGVEREHFAAGVAAREPTDIAAIPHPRLGFAGVIDERFDFALIDALAERRPEWHFVLIGPTAKIDPEDLPQRPNIHYLGQRGYDVLPAYYAAFDVALIPFALNDATRFISPTKTLEYLAAGVPVVSTPIRDVVSTFSPPAVRIAGDVDAFEAAVEAARAAGRSGAHDAVEEILDRHAWDRIADEMQTILAAQADEAEATA